MTDGDRRSLDVSRRGVLGAMAAGGVGWFGAGASGGRLGDGRTADRTRLGPTLVEADETAGFNFPYYLYAPGDPADAPLLVEPVNSGGASDDFQEDLNAAERTVRSGRARRIADAVGMPLLVPVFANPRSGEFWNRFVQSLDTETMRIESGKFERIDRQLLAMVDDARDRLADDGVTVPPEFAMNGFSASGNFVNNFAVLHPERVTTVTAGAINGMATLPRAEAKGYTLNYQIGIADLPELIGEPFDVEAWREVDQLNYMGAEERSPNDDTLPYRDVWSEEQATIARAVYGKDMQEDRMPYSEALYEAADASARFEVYDGVGHSYNAEILDDIISFHIRHNGLSRVGFADRPGIGDAAVGVDIALPPSEAAGAPDGDRFDVRVFADGTDVTSEPITVPAGAALSRDLPLDWPLEAGQTATVAVLPSGEQRLDAAVATGSVDVLSRATIVDPPTAGDGQVTVEYELAAQFDDRVVVSVVPPGEAVYWQRRVRVARIGPGDRGRETVQLEAGEGTSLGLGEEVQLWLIPSGNQVPDRTIATDTAPIVGVRFAEEPVAGDDSVALDVRVPESAREGTVRLAVDGADPVTVGTVTESGATTRRFDLPADAGIAPLEGGAELTASLVTGDRAAPLDQTTATVERTNVAALSIESEPADLGDELTVSYALDGVYDPGDFVSLRLYSSRGSSWGISLGRVDPGGEATETVTVDVDEAGVPFADGDRLTVAMVDDDDPYARDPLASDETVVGGAGGSPVFRARIREPADGATVPADESLSVRVAAVNVGDADGEARVALTAGDWRTTETAAVAAGEEGAVTASVPSSELAVDERTVVLASVDGHTARVVVTGTEEADPATTEPTASDTDTAASTTETPVPDGDDRTSTRTVSDAPPTPTTDATDVGDPTDATETTGDEGGGAPGFEVPGALATLAGVWYALERTTGDEADDD